MMSSPVMSLQQAAARYIKPPATLTSNFLNAKRDFHTIQAWLHEKLRTCRQDTQPVPYAGVKSSRYLEDALRIEDANFDMVVTVEAAGVQAKPHPVCRGAYVMSGLSDNWEMFSSGYRSCMGMFHDDVQSCLEELVETDATFAGRIAMCGGPNCQVIVDECPDPENPGGVPYVTTKHFDLLPPWFTINLRLVVSTGQDCYTAADCPEQEAGAWMQYREDPCRPQSKPLEVLLQALLYTEPFLCQHSTHDIAASAVALYAARVSNRHVDWSDVEERLLGVLDELEKAYRCRHLPYYQCTNVNLLHSIGKKRARKMAQFLCQFMFKSCKEVREVLSGIVGKDAK